MAEQIIEECPLIGFGWLFARPGAGDRQSTFNIFAAALGNVSPLPVLFEVAPSHVMRSDDVRLLDSVAAPGTRAIF
ncbi:hypothetical protein ACXHMN_18805 [Rhizobium sp. LEGMi12c]